MDTLLTKDFVNVNEKLRQVRGAKAAPALGVFVARRSGGADPFLAIVPE
jgi:hypothetical protein